MVWTYFEFWSEVGRVFTVTQPMALKLLPPFLTAAIRELHAFIILHMTSNTYVTKPEKWEADELSQPRGRRLKRPRIITSGTTFNLWNNKCLKKNKATIDQFRWQQPTAMEVLCSTAQQQSKAPSGEGKETTAKEGHHPLFHDRKC